MSGALPDILEGDLDIVFIGTNPGDYSAKRGHYYASASNRFWPMLYQSGLLPRLLPPEDDWKLPRFRMGLTDLVKRATPGAGDLSVEELKKGGTLLQKKIQFYQPRMVCLNGLLVYQSLLMKNDGPGLKEETFGSAKVFVIPSTSARNARYTNQMFLRWLCKLFQLKNQIHA